MLVEDLGQFRDDETELVVAEELPECQSLKGAVHQLLNALQRHLLIDLGFGCGTTAAQHYGKSFLLSFSHSLRHVLK